MRRVYEKVIQEHLESERQMAFVFGPRQVGKTTSCRVSAATFPDSSYLSWDHRAHRRVLSGGPEAILAHIGADRLGNGPRILILDELHRFGRWKDLLKGLFDVHGSQLGLVVTGSARLDIYRAGQDSLLGRYFPYRMHPVSVGELVRPELPGPALLGAPAPIDDALWATLQRYGGFPEPLVRAEDRFYRRWRRTRTERLLREDLRELTRVRELGQLEVLADLLRAHAGSLTSYATLSRQIGVSINTVKTWVETLSRLYWSFPVPPWHRNVARALRKEPKYYLHDWSLVEDAGARAENLVACALLKSVHLWSDLGHGDCGLWFVRDTAKREVDFLVSRDGEPWFLVEVKLGGTDGLSPALRSFQRQTGATHALQASFGLPYVDRSCFEETRPQIVPARTLLSQLA